MADDPNPDDRAAMRAFLQRSEVRLSSVHRAATALLSGAGVLVLLPTLARDTIVTVVRALLETQRGPATALLLAAVGLVVMVIAAVVVLLLSELTRFYFHTNHHSGPSGVTFAPRFGLSSLRLPDDELSDAAAALLTAARADAGSVELAVAPNDRTRRRIDAQVAAHGGTHPADDDHARAVQLLRLVGAHDHDLATEVARSEYGMARHTQRLQVIVLRYLKALLVVIVSLVLAMALTAVLTPPVPAGVDPGAAAVALLLLWSPATMVAAAAPVRWLGRMLRTEGATGDAIRYDPELTRLERVVATLSTLVTACAALAGADLVRMAGGTAMRPMLIIVITFGAALQGGALLAARRAGGAARTRAGS